MMAMSKTLGLRWSRRTGQKARGALWFCAALWLVFYIAYTPIHLYLEPHCDGAHVGTGPAPVHNGDCLAGDTHAGDHHHERHPAEQHQFKLTQPTRVMVSDMMPVQAMEWVDPYEGSPQVQVVGFSGLSPPELLCSWRFILRAALPVRAPSLLS